MHFQSRSKIKLCELTRQQKANKEGFIVRRGGLGMPLGSHRAAKVDGASFPRRA